MEEVRAACYIKPFPDHPAPQIKKLHASIQDEYGGQPGDYDAYGAEEEQEANYDQGDGDGDADMGIPGQQQVRPLDKVLVALLPQAH